MAADLAVALAVAVALVAAGKQGANLQAVKRGKLQRFKQGADLRKLS